MTINQNRFKLFLCTFFIALSAGVNAQDRIGIGFTNSFYELGNAILRFEETSTNIRPVIGMQRWLSAKYFNYYTLDYSKMVSVELDYKDQPSLRRKEHSINFHFGQGAYFGKKRFEDNTAIFGTYGFSLGTGYIKTESWEPNNKGIIKHSTSFMPSFQLSFIELGLGLEQRISDRLFANASVNLNLGMLSYGSINMRLYYSRYQH